MIKLSHTNILLLLILFTSCGIKNASIEKPIGGNKDQYGCLVSAGYTWSKIKQNCIRPFEEGIVLVQINNNSSYTTATYLLLGNNHEEAEIFTPGVGNSILLKKDKNQNYSNGKYHLIQENNKWALYIGKNKEFEQEK